MRVTTAAEWGNTTAVDQAPLQVKEPDTDWMAAHLLIMAAVTLIGAQHEVSKELLYVARTLSHPLIVVERAKVQE
jgi:hypothetical protein